MSKNPDIDQFKPQSDRIQQRRERIDLSRQKTQKPLHTPDKPLDIISFSVLTTSQLQIQKSLKLIEETKV